MNNADALTKQYVRRPQVFADLFNHLMYGGQPVLKPEDMTEMDPAELAFPFGGDGKISAVQKYRDAVKQVVSMQDGKAAYLLVLGIENQTNVHYAMPARNMLYDALNYASQIGRIARHHRQSGDLASGGEFLSGMTASDRLVPVITLVVYFGQTEWDGPTSLHEMLETRDETVLKYTPDYRINLIAPISMSEEETESFHSDFRLLAGMIRTCRDKTAMSRLLQTEDFRHMDPLTAAVANEVTSSKLRLTTNEKGEVDMCIAMQEILEDAKYEGKIEGKIEGALEMLCKLVQQNILSPEVAAAQSGRPLSDFNAAYIRFLSSQA